MSINKTIIHTNNGENVDTTTKTPYGETYNQSAQNGAKSHLDQIRVFVEDGTFTAPEEEDFQTWLKDNDLTEDDFDYDDLVNAENEGCYFVDGEFITDMDYINSEFLDFGYLRELRDENVLQFLTGFGGPNCGFHIHANGSVSYFYAWGWDSGVHWLSNSDAKIFLSFIEMFLECSPIDISSHSLCEMVEYKEWWGLNEALDLLKILNALDSEDSEEE
jgi:hypothetical protein